MAEVAAAETTDNYLQKARLHLATPTDVAAQKELMSAAGKAVKRGAAVIRAAQEAAKAAGDVIVLEEAADEADDSLVKLRETLRAARTACWSLDMDDALVEIANLKVFSLCVGVCVVLIAAAPQRNEEVLFPSGTPPLQSSHKYLFTPVLPPPFFARRRRWAR